MLATREKVKKTNFSLFPSTVDKLREMSITLDRSISSVIRLLVESGYERVIKVKGDSLKSAK